MIKTKQEYEHARMTLLKNIVMNEIDELSTRNAQIEMHETFSRIENRKLESESIQKEIDALPMNKRKDFQ